MSKTHVCDVPGCGGTRRKWQRLCDRCFAALPGDIRSGILDAHRQRKRPEHRRQCKRAAAHLGLNRPAEAVPAPAAIANRVSPERSYELQQRMLGERP